MHNIFEKNDIEHRIFLFFSATVVNNRRLDVWTSTLMNIMQVFFLAINQFTDFLVHADVNHLTGHSLFCNKL